MLPKPRSARVIARDILRAENPDQYVQTLPCQTLFLAIKALGLESSLELLDLASDEQYRLMLDLEFWQADQFNEESFWFWLLTVDQDEDLDPLARMVRSLDLKLIARLIQQHVDVISYEDNASQPPDEGFYTPDKGYTWIRINIEDTDRHRGMGRVLAFIFETNADLFYQLVSLKLTTTPSELEENAFQDKYRRLEDEGFPSTERAAEVNSALDLKLALEKLATNNSPANSLSLKFGIPKIEPLVYRVSFGSELNMLLDEIKDQNDFERYGLELSLIANSALMYFKVDLSDFTQIEDLVERISGALSIGFELLKSAKNPSHHLSSLELFQALGLIDIYRVGLGPIYEVRRQALSVSNQQATQIAQDPQLLAILAGARERFPVIPKFLKSEQNEDLKLEASFCAIENLAEVNKLKQTIKQSFSS